MVPHRFNHEIDLDSLSKQMKPCPKCGSKWCTHAVTAVVGHGTTFINWTCGSTICMADWWEPYHDPKEELPR